MQPTGVARCVHAPIHLIWLHRYQGAAVQCHAQRFSSSPPADGAVWSVCGEKDCAYSRWAANSSPLKYARDRLTGQPKIKGVGEYREWLIYAAGSPWRLISRERLRAIAPRPRRKPRSPERIAIIGRDEARSKHGAEHKAR
jgi:hypothetical protein